MLARGVSAVRIQMRKGDPVVVDMSRSVMSDGPSSLSENSDAIEMRQARARGGSSNKSAEYEDGSTSLTMGGESGADYDAPEDDPHEQDFVVMMTVVSLVFMVPSLVTLLAGLVVFVWAELSLGVSIPVTVALGAAYIFLVFAQKVSMGTVLASLRRKRLQRRRRS